MGIETQSAAVATPRPSAPVVLPLEPGDHLTAEEFERRFDAMPEFKKAELIEGVVYLPSPVRIDAHGNPDNHIGTWLGVYEAFTPGTQAGANSTVRLDKENVPQPDRLLRILPEYGGRTNTADGYVVGGPELNAEVSASSASYDLHVKLQVFWRHGVLEYLVWRVYDRVIDWFVRGDQEYDRLVLQNGIFKSRVFPGLWLAAEAMIAGDMAKVLAVLQQGLESPDHKAFCDELQKRRQALASRAST
jgi:hypothetical protein